MARRKVAEEMTPKDIRSLPWPQALRDPDRTLTTADAYKVGQLIVEKIYDGQYSSGPERKAWSLRKLQAILNSGSAATLNRAVQTYQIAKSLGMKPPWRHIEMGHLVRVAPLQKRVQKRLLSAAEKNGWSVRTIEAEARKLRGGKSNRGRPPSPGFVKAINALSREELLSNMDRVAFLDTSTKKQLAGQIIQLQKDLQRVQKELKRRGF